MVDLHAYYSSLALPDLPSFSYYYSLAFASLTFLFLFLITALYSFKMVSHFSLTAGGIVRSLY